MQHDLINEEVIKNIVKEVVSGYQRCRRKKQVKTMLKF